jgi:hypothetical protein
LNRASRIDSPKWLTKRVSITALKNFATFTPLWMLSCTLSSSESSRKDPSLTQIV